MNRLLIILLVFSFQGIAEGKTNKLKPSDCVWSDYKKNRFYCQTEYNENMRFVDKRCRNVGVALSRCFKYPLLNKKKCEKINKFISKCKKAADRKDDIARIRRKERARVEIGEIADSLEI